MAQDSRPTVLLVEDEPAQREVLSYNLDAEGFRVVSADNGEDALMLVDEEAPDIIILDLKLGAMNGFDFLKVLRKDELTRHIPVIVISGDNSRQSVDQAYEIGANAMFRKPASLDGYRSMISSIVDYWQKTARHSAACPA